MNPLVYLKPNDSVEIIAPASRCTDNSLDALKHLLLSWGLNVQISPNIFGDDLLCANDDETRANHLITALSNPLIKAIICLRGGYGSMKLIPRLQAIAPPATPKLFVGMSDITALHLYFQQAWSWQTIHGSLNVNHLTADSLLSVKSLLFGLPVINNPWGTVVSLNKQARALPILSGMITGGNLSLIQSSIGTSWQMQAHNKIILLEEINERAYCIDRMLEHLLQAKLFSGAKAVLLGDFLNEKEPEQDKELIPKVLTRFAEQLHIPVVQIKGVGHGKENFALLLGGEMQINLSN